jgi:FixJ family two-component response regulator
VEADRLVGSGGGVAVAIRAATPGEVLALLARAHGLSARERELVGLVVAGLDTAAIARRLGISRHTVGVRRRLELVSHLLGVEDPGELAASA